MTLTNEYIRGLIDGEGSFTFCTAYKNWGDIRPKLPTFILTMHERDLELIQALNETLGIKSNIYRLGPYRNDGVNRGAIARIMVRDLGTLKNIIIPLFYNRLKGYKGHQFNEWLEKIGSDPAVPDRYKLLYRLHKTGYFTRELSPTGLFRKFLD